MTLATFDTRETADCVEACPISGFEDSMVVATYQLHKEVVVNIEAGNTSNQLATTDRRSGTLQHFHLRRTNDSVDVNKLDEIEMSSGVFDIKWAGQLTYDKVLLGAATANGSVELLTLEEHHDANSSTSFNRLKHMASTNSTDDGSDNAMCLSLDWNNRLYVTNTPAMCISHSDGYGRML